MKKNKYRFINIIVAALILFSSYSNAQSSKAGFEDVKIETIKITDNVYMLQGKGGNIGVFTGDDGVFLVDDQYAQITDKIKSAISNITSKPVKFVIITHFHGDHVGGNESFAKDGALIVSHANTRKRLTEEQSIEYFNKKLPPLPGDALPVITFDSSMTFFLNEDEVYAFHAASAHTDGDVIVYFRKQNVIHMGDIYLSGTFPFIDLPNGGSINGLIDGIDKALNIINPGTKIIPGHGTVSTQSDILAYKEMLVVIRDRIEEQLKQNRSLDEIIFSKPAKGYYETTKSSLIPPEDFLRFVYEGLTKK